MDIGILLQCTIIVLWNIVKYLSEASKSVLIKVLKTSMTI